VGKLVIAHADRRAQRTLQRLVGATRSPVEVVADGPALMAAVDPDAIAIVDIAFARAHPGLRDRPAQAWIAVPGDGSEPAGEANIEWLLATGWWHILSHPMPLLAEELLATLQKLRRREVFGLDKYMAWGAEIQSYTLGDADERDDAVGMVTRDVLGVGLPERIGSLVSVITDELIANALYLAPRDDHHQRPRAGEERGRSRALRGRDVVTVRWATDARTLAIEVRDRWGTLDPRSVTRRLATGRLNRTGAPGDAGMGLALAYACCHQFVIDLEPEVMTEVIALLDVRPRPIELGRCASFHSFLADAPRES
jgi:hypothetical protein